MIKFHAVGAIVEGLLESDPVGGIMSVRQQWMSFGTQMTVDVQVSLRTRAWYNAGLLKVQLLTRFTSCAPSVCCLLLFSPPVMSDSFWPHGLQAFLSFTISQSVPKFMSIASVMPSSHHILRCSLLLLPSIFPSIRVFSNKSAVCIRWPKYRSFSISLSILGWFPLRLTCLISLLSGRLSGVFSSTTVLRHQFFGALPSLQSGSHNHTWPLGRP